MRRLRDQSQRSDREAIEHLVNAHYDDVLSYCRRHTCNWEDAQDAAQETFLRFVHNFKRYIDCGKPLAYLLTIARNVCIDRYRSNDDRCEPLEVDVEDCSNEIDAVDLGLLVEQLPADLAEAIELRYGQGLKVKEVAVVLGVSRFSAMRMIERALKTMRDGLQFDESGGKEVNGYEG